MGIGRLREHECDDEDPVRGELLKIAEFQPEIPKEFYALAQELKALEFKIHQERKLKLNPDASPIHEFGSACLTLRKAADEEINIVSYTVILAGRLQTFQKLEVIFPAGINPDHPWFSSMAKRIDDIILCVFEILKSSKTYDIDLKYYEQNGLDGNFILFPKGTLKK